MSIEDVLLGERSWHVEHADCLAVLHELPSECIDAVITDPPYSSGGCHRSDRMQLPSAKYVPSTTKIRRPDFSGDNRDQRSFGFWCALWLGECLRIAEPGAPLCLFSDWRQIPTATDALQAGGWIWRGIVVWDKTGACRPSLGRFANQAEYVIWGSKGPMRTDRGVGCLSGVFPVPVRVEDKLHITGKPLELMLDVVDICPPGAVVLDPFCGSGTTGVASLRRRGRFIGVDHEASYATLARDRLRAEEHLSALNPMRAGQVPLFGDTSPLRSGSADGLIRENGSWKG